jgi:NAD(P)-dependent dehydrogenase (short-subunit alcohol dehydrogenase family)
MMDTSDEESIARGSAEIINGSAFPNCALGAAKERRLDLLVNNAGFYGSREPIGKLNASGAPS